jgi:hypothetical protein
MQRLEERVRLLAAENDGYQKEMIDKAKEIEERDTAVLVLTKDVETEREKVKVMEEDRERGSEGLESDGSAQVIYDAGARQSESSSPHMSESALSQTSDVDVDPDGPGQDPDGLSALRDAVDRQAKELTDLASMDDLNPTHQRVAKFNDIRSQLASLIDQANLEGPRLHGELDRKISMTLVRVFSFILILTCVLLLKYFHDYLYGRFPAQPCLF